MEQRKESQCTFATVYLVVCHYVCVCCFRLLGISHGMLRICETLLIKITEKNLMVSNKSYMNMQDAHGAYKELVTDLCNKRGNWLLTIPYLVDIP